MKKLILLILIIALLVLTGCGNKQPETPEEVAKAYFKALNKCDIKKANEYLSESGLNYSYEYQNIEQVEKMCKMIIKDIKYTHTNTEIDGDDAIIYGNILVITPMGDFSEKEDYHLVKENGQWKLDEEIMDWG